VVELREHLTRIEADSIIEAEELAALVADISMVLMDLGLAPVQQIP
jgi:hypothetical protein